MPRLVFVPGQTSLRSAADVVFSPNTNLRVIWPEDNQAKLRVLNNTFEDLSNLVSEAVPGSRVDNSLTTISRYSTKRIGKGDFEMTGCIEIEKIDRA